MARGCAALRFLPAQRCIVTIALVLILNRFAFPAHGVSLARLVIFVALAAVAVFGIALPSLRITRAWAVKNAEAANTELQQRLTTFQERDSKGDDPFLELLAADTLVRTRHSDADIAHSR